MIPLQTLLLTGVLVQGGQEPVVPKVLMVVTSHQQMGDTDKPTGYWLSELTHPFLVLADHGFTVDIASIAGGKAPIDPASMDMDDADNKRFMENPTWASMLEHTLVLDKVNSADYQAIVFSGGHGTMWDFPDNAAVQRIAAEIYERSGIVAAVCHGPAALVNIRLSDGSYLIHDKKVTGFSNEEEQAVALTEVVPFLLEDAMIARGAHFAKAAPWQGKVVVDQRVVTGQNPQSASELGEAIVGLLKEKP